MLTPRTLLVSSYEETRTFALITLTPEELARRLELGIGGLAAHIFTAYDTAGFYPPHIIDDEQLSAEMNVGRVHNMFSYARMYELDIAVISFNSEPISVYRYDPATQEYVGVKIDIN